MIGGKSDPKSMAVMLLASKKKDGEHDEPESEGESSGGEGLHAAAEEILAAIEAKDAGKLAESLKAFCQMADDDAGEPEEEEGDSGGESEGE